MASYIRRANTNCYGLIANTNRVDETLAPLTVDTPKKCLRACTQSKTCQNAVFVKDTKRCFLKNNITKCINQNGQDSYLKTNVLRPCYYNRNFYN